VGGESRWSRVSPNPETATLSANFILFVECFSSLIAELNKLSPVRRGWRRQVTRDLLQMDMVELDNVLGVFRPKPNRKAARGQVLFLALYVSNHVLVSLADCDLDS